MKEDKKKENTEQGIVVGSLDIKGEKTVGEILSAARERSGLTLEAISQETRIPGNSIEYLETDNFEAIPAKVYVTGFLRTYAGILGLDVHQILSKYEIQTGQTHTSKGDCWEIEENVIEETLASPQIFKKFVLPLLAVIILIMAILWLVSRTGGEKIDPPEDFPAAGQPSEVEQESTRDDTPAPEQGGKARDGDFGDDKESGSDTAEREPAGSRTTPAPVSKPVKNEPFELRIIASGTDTTWFDVVVYTEVDSRPDSIFRDFILYPGEVQSFRVTDSVFFRTIGNAGGFAVERNGRKLPPLGSRGEVKKNIRITRADIIGD